LWERFSTAIYSIGHTLPIVAFHLRIQHLGSLKPDKYKQRLGGHAGAIFPNVILKKRSVLDVRFLASIKNNFITKTRNFESTKFISFFFVLS